MKYLKTFENLHQRDHYKTMVHIFKNFEHYLRIKANIFEDVGYDIYLPSTNSIRFIKDSLHRISLDKKYAFNKLIEVCEIALEDISIETRVYLERKDGSGKITKSEVTHIIKKYEESLSNCELRSSIGDPVNFEYLELVIEMSLKPFFDELPRIMKKINEESNVLSKQDKIIKTFEETSILLKNQITDILTSMQFEHYKVTDNIFIKKGKNSRYGSVNINTEEFTPFYKEDTDLYNTMTLEDAAIVCEVRMLTSEQDSKGYKSLQSKLDKFKNKLEKKGFFVKFLTDNKSVISVYTEYHLNDIHNKLIKSFRKINENTIFIKSDINKIKSAIPILRRKIKMVINESEIPNIEIDEYNDGSLSDNGEMGIVLSDIGELDVDRLMGYHTIEEKLYLDYNITFEVIINNEHGSERDQFGRIEKINYKFKPEIFLSKTEDFIKDLESVGFKCTKTNYTDNKSYMGIWVDYKISDILDLSDKFLKKANESKY